MKHIWQVNFDTQKHDYKMKLEIRNSKLEIQEQPNFQFPVSNFQSQIFPKS